MKRFCLVLLMGLPWLSPDPDLFSQPNFWQQMVGGYDVRSLAINTNDHIFAGTAGSGILRSTDNGASWTPVNSGLSDPYVWVLAINSDGHVFAGTFAGVFRSTDNGESWASRGLVGSHIAALAIDASGRIFAGERTGTQGGVFRSTDNGETWTPTGPAGAQVYSLAINRNGPPPLIGQIFAGTEGSGIFRSTDNGTNWTQVNTGLTLWYVPALAINSSGHIFGGTTAGADAGVVRSTNNGENWTPVLTGPSVSALVTNSSGHIYASGVFRSTDNGEHWDTVSSGVTDYVWAFAVNSGGYIFAGTGGSGVFRSVQSTTFVPERHGGQPTSFTLGQNYPNPFNPKTSIKFKVQSSKLVTLRVYNVLGQEVATLVNEELQPGSYEVAWDAEGLASGVYFYRLAAGEFTAAKKLVLLL